MHYLRHDGSLYRSSKSLDECATRINTYLKDWNAAGFRAGFMFHNLEWLKSLDIEYDTSTFDTDPFEPQPDGLGTIFHFVVEDPDGGRSYVEIPDTLPQRIRRAAIRGFPHSYKTTTRRRVLESPAPRTGPFRRQAAARAKRTDPPHSGSSGGFRLAISNRL